MTDGKIGAVILAAGHGTRMKSELPKVMHDLKGKPLVEHVVDNVIESGCCEKPVVIVSKDHTYTQDHLKDKAQYAIQAEQLGTGHATACAEAMLKGKVDHVVVLYGDMPYLSGASMKRLVDHHINSGSVMSVMTATTPDFEDWRSAFKMFGRVLRNEDGTLDRIVEWKDATKEQLQIRELSTCYFCFKADWLWDRLKKVDNNNVQKEYYLVDLLKMAKEEGETIVPIDVDLKEVIGINSKEDLERARAL